MKPIYGRDQFVKRPRGTPCPALLWFLIGSASDKEERPFELLRTIARSPTPFKLRNPDLKQALEALDLEWLKPSQISRIRMCLAPTYKLPRYRRQWFRPIGRYSDPAERAPRCQKLFWAWRGDQKTCDEHLEYAAMFRVQKHRKDKQKRRDNLLQLKDARAELKRARRKRRGDKKRSEQFAQKAMRALTYSQQQPQSYREDLWLLQGIRLEHDPETLDAERLERMFREGYVILHPEEPGMYKLTGRGYELLKELRERVYRGPGTN